MKSLKIYQIDAFTDKLFSGNPAAVCILNNWLPDKLMQNIASENNLSETAFLVKKKKHYEIRWFTPNVEVDLCGHATLASAFILFKYYEKEATKITFYSHRSGELTVTKSNNDLITMNFPTDVFNKISNNDELNQAIGKKPLASFEGKTDIMLVFEDEATIAALQPDFNALGKFNVRGIIVTAKGNHCDFVSRFFAPYSGINEDPVTGSAHTTLTPYWAKVFNKNKLTAQQISKRGGHLVCEYLDDRVQISGKAILYMIGEIVNYTRE
ncbi:MAG: PhzF family phenazine biosynthesis protein [Saprospiraceae bacterium]